MYDVKRKAYDKFMKEKAPLWKKRTMDDPATFGWKTKEKESTFFPDDWNKEKIKNEIGEAYANMEFVKKNVPDWKWWTKDISWYIWKLQDWTPIEFKNNADWSISSAYPNFQFKD